MTRRCIFRCEPREDSWPIQIVDSGVYFCGAHHHRNPEHDRILYELADHFMALYLIREGRESTLPLMERARPF